MDETTFENQGVLRDIRKCRKDTDIQCHYGLLPSGHCGTEVAAGHIDLYVAENFKPLALRKISIDDAFRREWRGKLSK